MVTDEPGSYGEIKAWMIGHPDEATKIWEEIQDALTKHRLQQQIEALEKEKNSQAMSYGRKVAKLEKERDELKTKLGLPVEPKKAKKKSDPDPPPAEGEGEHFAKPATLSERLADKEKEK